MEYRSLFMEPGEGEVIENSSCSPALKVKFGMLDAIYPAQTLSPDLAKSITSKQLVKIVGAIKEKDKQGRQRIKMLIIDCAEKTKNNVNAIPASVT